MFASLKRPVQRDRRPGAERITALPRIKSIVRRLQADRELLYVQVPGCDQPANTAVLGMREKRGVVYLDELSTHAAHRALLQRRQLKVTGRLQGMQLSFTTRLLGVSDENGLATYEVALPVLITRAQRRENFRLRLGSGLIVPVTIADLEGDSVKGEVFDLSTTGLGAYLQTRKSPAPGTVLAGVRLSLPSERLLNAGIEIRFARHNTAQHLLRIGARFVGMEPAQERQIARFLAEQQRKRRRFEPR